MALTVYPTTNTEQWDAVVCSFTDYDIYWLNGYVKAFELHGDGEPLLIFYEDENTRGINVVMKRDVAKDPRFQGKIPEGRYYDLATVYGYGGWIIEGGETEELFKAYEAWAREEGFVSEFVRFHPMLENQRACEAFYEVRALGEVVHIPLISSEEIWAGFHSKKRNTIRRAIKNGVRIFHGREPEAYEVFRTIYNETMDKDHAEQYYYFRPSFYQSLREDLPDNNLVFWAESEGRVVAAAIMLFSNGRMNYHLSGSVQEYNHLAPTDLLIYEAALWGQKQGFRSLYLGGGVGSGEDSLFHFKRGFYKGNLRHFYIGRKIFDPVKYEQLLELRSTIDRPGFFPQYRG